MPSPPPLAAPFALALALAASGAGCGAPPMTPPPEPVPLAIDPAPEPAPAPTAPAALAVATSGPDDDLPPFRCKDGQLFVADDRVYCVQKEPTPFAESAAWCAGNGGVLATIGSDAETRALSLTLRSPVGFDDRAWIGLAEVREGDFRWTDVRALKVTAWAPGEPNDLGGEHCGEMYASGQWNDLACSTAIPFLCERRGGKGPGGAQLKCGVPTFRAGTTTYCLDTQRSLPWLEARKACQAAGGDLASFDSKEELSAFRAAALSALASSALWLGVTDAEVEGKWRAPKGRTPDFTKWRSGEPNDVGGEDCAEWYPSDGGWNDISCAIPHAGLCVPR
jgi:hypothetical protein